VYILHPKLAAGSYMSCFSMDEQKINPKLLSVWYVMKLETSRVRLGRL